MTSNLEIATFRQTVVVQGLGFVGAAMAVAVANAVNKDNSPCFDVIGIDLNNTAGNKRINSINSGIFPFETVDTSIIKGTADCVKRGNLRATTDESVIEKADIILVSVNLDINEIDGSNPSINFTPFKSAISTLGLRVKAGALIIVETTVPPGTCVNIVQPILHKHLTERNMDPNSVFVAHSYERVMPGAQYLDSIVNFWRVFSGLTTEAANKCEDFLSKVINTAEYPLSRLKNTYASETAKVLENSYRAVTIAFMEEWARFAEDIGFDLFEVIDAIRLRPTHSNMRQPGFGVGGYCLTKDPLFAKLAAKDLFNLDGHKFPFSSQAIKINQIMPIVTLNKLKEHFGSLEGKNILLMGISYRQDVGDTRYSPSEKFTIQAIKEGANVFPCDPFVKFWEEMNMTVSKELPDSSSFDAVVFAVPHQNYKIIEFREWLTKNQNCVIFDANNVLTIQQYSTLKNMGLTCMSIGRG